MREFRILSPTAILGYGYPLASLQRGLDLGPDLIAVDAGSSDPGPYYLGAGVSFTDRIGVKRDLRPLITEGVRRGIPVVVGTAGGSGARSHLEGCIEIVREIAREESLRFRLGVVAADIDRALLHRALDAGRITPLDCVPEATHADIDACTNIVAQMGIEPIIRAHQARCDVILCGRAYDPAVFAALPVALGFDEGLATHLGKILECAAIAASPGSGSDAVLGTLFADCFELQALSPERRFTRESTVAHTLYEKSDPYSLPGPGGTLNLSAARFEETGGGRVRVSGSVFERSDASFVKLEGARPVGYRTVSIAGARDPVLIAQTDSLLAAVRDRVTEILRSEAVPGRVHFHVYGKDGVMGPLEPEREIRSHEIAVVIEAVGPTQAAADTLCSITRSTLLHFGYPGRISTAGNLAFPFSPSDLKAGPVYEFALYHLLRLEGEDLFPLETVEVGA